MSTARLAAARRPGTTADIRQVDSFRTDWYDPFFNSIGAQTVGGILAVVNRQEPDLNALVTSQDLADTVCGHAYWLLCLKGYLQYRGGGALGRGNVYFDYLHRHFGDDPDLFVVLRDPQRLTRRIKLRFDDLTSLRRNGLPPAFAPLAVVGGAGNEAITAQATKRVFQLGAAQPVEAVLIDGYHRLFFARLCGVRALPCDFIEQRDAVIL